jgi:pyruvate/2-oxoglutarate dehydrogenase complex dihydrolipoamide dehydrogenase (E3) component
VSHPEEYDVVVLGSGRARFFAWSLASQGKRVAVVERRNLAGSCPTIACAPSKNVIHGAKVANYFRRGAEFGIAAGDWKVEMPAVRDRKRKMVDGIVALNVNAYRESGAELVKGQGRFVGPRRIEVTADDGINPATILIRDHEDLVVSGGTPIVTGSGAIPCQA